jgi:hypothetical protein
VLDIDTSEPLPGESQPARLAAEQLAEARDPSSFPYARESEINVVNVVTSVVSAKIQPADSKIDVVNVVSTRTPLDSPATDEPSPSIPGEHGAEQLAQARRIAQELVKLHRAGAIATKGDASFYANLIRDFDATYLGPMSNIGKDLPPGPYVPTKAQRVPQPPTAFPGKRESSSIKRTWPTHSAMDPSFPITGFPPARAEARRKTPNPAEKREAFAIKKGVPLARGGSLMRRRPA